MTTVNGSRESYSQVGQVVSRLRNYEDYNLALRLQEEEYNRHFEMNRGQRRQVRNDGKHSRSQQEMEDQITAQLRRQLNTQLTESDEALARRLQEELEREEAQQKELQARHDEELARRLHENDVAEQRSVRQTQAHADEQLARRLQMIESQAQAAYQNHDSRTVEEDEKLARELQKRFDEEKEERRRRKEDDQKKSLLKTLIPNPSKWSRSLQSPKECEHSIIRRWQDSVDADTENEVNLEMAGASRTAAPRDGPPPYSSAIGAEGRDAIVSRRPPGHRPLATIATREPRSDPHPGTQIRNQEARLVNTPSGGANPLDDSLNRVQLQPDYSPIQRQANPAMTGALPSHAPASLQPVHLLTRPQPNPTTDSLPDYTAISRQLDPLVLGRLPNPEPAGLQPEQSNRHSGYASSPKQNQGSSEVEVHHAVSSGRTTGIVNTEPDLITFDDSSPTNSSTSASQTNQLRSAIF